MGYLYLAQPYSGTADQREERYRAALLASARLMLDGKVVYSPIAHSHMIEKLAMCVELSHAFWMRQCIAMLDGADELVVLKLDGWESSRGVTQEIAHAQRRGIPISFILP